MNNEALQNDETFHRSVGNVCQNSCPESNTHYYKETGSPPQISDSPPIDISPHHLLEDLEQDKPSNQLLLNININLIVERSVVIINH